MHGTHNMSKSTPLGLESMLLFRQNQRICDQFAILQRNLAIASTRWPLIYQYGLKGVEIGRQEYAMYAEHFKNEAESKGEPASDDT